MYEMLKIDTYNTRFKYFGLSNIFQFSQSYPYQVSMFRDNSSEYRRIPFSEYYQVASWFMRDRKAELTKHLTQA